MPGRKQPEESRREDILRAAYDVAARHGIEALTLRAVAERADVSHGTVLFHFRRRDELVATLLDRVLYATVVLRVPEDVAGLTRPSEQLGALLNFEMERLSEESRHFRLFLEYYALGVRKAAIRRRVRAALDEYRRGFQSLAEKALEAQAETRTRRGSDSRAKAATPDGVASVAVSLIHGCALQALVAPREFHVQQHYVVAARLLDELA
jgi:TetR/AcrR family transcriptional regulator, transcriptional repressor of bet genes